MARAFIANPLQKKTVNHRNRKDDNNVDNLEWATCKEQQAAIVSRNHQLRPIQQIDIQTGTPVTLHGSPLLAAKAMFMDGHGVRQAGYITRMALQNRPAYGFRWQFVQSPKAVPDVLPQEIWQKVTCTHVPSNCEVSTHGRVRGKHGIHNGYKDAEGYCFVNIKGRIYKRSRIVAQTFLPNPKCLPVVNHLDGIKDNDAIENLEWCSHRDNTIHAGQMGLTKYKVRAVQAFDADTFAFLGEFATLRDAAAHSP